MAIVESYQQVLEKADAEFSTMYPEIKEQSPALWDALKFKNRFNCLMYEIEWLREVLTDPYEPSGAYTFVNDFFGEKVMTSGCGYVKEIDDNDFF